MSAIPIWIYDDFLNSRRRVVHSPFCVANLSYNRKHRLKAMLPVCDCASWIFGVNGADHMAKHKLVSNQYWKYARRSPCETYSKLNMNSRISGSFHSFYKLKRENICKLHYKLQIMDAVLNGIRFSLPKYYYIFHIQKHFRTSWWNF